MEPAAVIASLKHEMEMPSPARPGDRLTLTMTCADKPVMKLRSLILVRRR